MKGAVAVSSSPVQGLRLTCWIFSVSLVLTGMIRFTGGRPARVETKWLRIKGLRLIFSYGEEKKVGGKGVRISECLKPNCFSQYAACLMERGWLV